MRLKLVDVGVRGAVIGSIHTLNERINNNYCSGFCGFLSLRAGTICQSWHEDFKAIVERSNSDRVIILLSTII